MVQRTVPASTCGPRITGEGYADFSIAPLAGRDLQKGGDMAAETDDAFIVIVVVP